MTVPGGPMHEQPRNWEDVGPGISQKRLRQDAETGAQTLLLRSQPRPAADITDRRPQYHPVDEEFFCLSGRFTLEGAQHWLTPMTYVYYPAGLAHGFSVDVPDGYEIYLRNSGAVTTERVDSPVQNSPYLVSAPDESRSGVIISDCSELIDHAVDSGQLSVIYLRHDELATEGALILCLPATGRIQWPINGPGAYAEFIVLAGEIQWGDQIPMGKLSYRYLSEPVELQATGTEPALVLLNYGGGDLAKAITRQAEVQHHAVNGYAGT